MERRNRQVKILFFYILLLLIGLNNYLILPSFAEEQTQMPPDQENRVVLYETDFSQKFNSGWRIGHFQDSDWQMIDGEYEAKGTSHKYFISSDPPDRVKIPGNVFTIQCDMRLLTKDGHYGIYFNFIDNDNLYYIFSVNPVEEKYSLYKRMPGVGLVFGYWLDQKSSD